MSNTAVATNTVQNLIDNVQDSLIESGFTMSEDNGYALTYAREARDGSTDEYQLNWDEGTVTREKYNMNGTRLLSEVNNIRSQVNVNQILRHL